MDLTSLATILCKFVSCWSRFFLNLFISSSLSRSSAFFVSSYSLVNILYFAFARIKDFRGLKLNGFDSFGNYTLGVKEHIIFPEVRVDKVDKIRGMDITIVTSGKNKQHSIALLSEFNFPFIKEKKN